MNKPIFEEMRDLGLAVLAHANRIEIQTDKWAEISILQIAHAAEILVKSRIAEVHHLLIFDKLPKPTRNNANIITDEISTAILASKGHTYEWHELPDILWATAEIKSVDKQKFKEFGDIRNSIQHFGICPNISYLTSLKFIYEVIDPFIYECWKLYAIDCSIDFDEEREDNLEYWNYIRTYLMYNKIEFKVSPTLVKNKDFWWTNLIVNGITLNVAEENDYVEPIEITQEYYEKIQINNIETIEEETI